MDSGTSLPSFSVRVPVLAPNFHLRTLTLNDLWPLAYGRLGEVSRGAGMARAWRAHRWSG